MVHLSSEKTSSILQPYDVLRLRYCTISFQLVKHKTNDIASFLSKHSEEARKCSKYLSLRNRLLSFNNFRKKAAIVLG